MDDIPGCGVKDSLAGGHFIVCGPNHTGESRLRGLNARPKMPGRTGARGVTLWHAARLHISQAFRNCPGNPGPVYDVAANQECAMRSPLSGCPGRISIRIY